MNSPQNTGDSATTKMSRQGALAKLLEFASAKLIGSIGGQAMVSGFHFALNLFLLRVVTPYEYGVFAFAFVIAMFASALNNALIATPLTVYTPVIECEQSRRDQEAMLGSLNVALFIALIIIGIGYTLLSAAPDAIAVAVTVFVATYSARHYSRSVGYARLQPLVTASGDVAYVVSGVVIIGFAYISTEKLGVTHVLLALAGANACAMIVERLRLKGVKHRWWSFANIRDYARYWDQSRWALAGSMTTLFMAQAHSVIITTTNGPNTFAPLAAGFVLFGPVRVALLTWQNMVKPELAIALSKFDDQRVKSQIRSTTWITVSAVLILSLCLWIAWPWVHAFLYAKQYADQPMALIVGLWAIITIFATSYNAPSAGLQAMRQFKVLAMASVYGAVLSGILVSVLLYWFNPEYTLFGILIAEAFMALYLTYILFSQLSIRAQTQSQNLSPESAATTTERSAPL